MFASRLGLPLTLLLALAATGQAQVAYPPKPEKYTVALRYRIRTDAEERIRQFRAMEQFLKRLGFEVAAREDADLEVFDPTAERMDGTIPAANAGRLLDSPSIVTALLIPVGQALPADGKTPVQVRIKLAAGLGEKEQADLHRQVVAHLGLMGFVENVAYDHAAYSLVRGNLPSENLYRLLKDLRTQPSGWFAPAVGPASLPLPLRSVMPVRFVEVLPDLATSAAPAVAPPPGGTPAPASPKLTPAARAVAEDPASQGKSLRVDLVLETPPGLNWRDVKVRIRGAAAGATIEGLVGVVATVRVMKPADLAGLAALPEVRSIRLPRSGSETIRSTTVGGDSAGWLESSHVADLHRAGYRGAGVRIVVIGSDFPGVGALIGQQLPAATRVVDLTTELSPDLEPSATRQAAGGTAAALAAYAAAPGAALILVRIDPTAMHQVETIARAVAGDGSYSDAMQSRSQELVSRTDALVVRRGVASEEYRQAFADLSDEDKPTKRRAAARAAMDKLVADEEILKAAIQRFGALKAGVDSLSGSGVVVNTLTWDTGYPLDGLSDPSRLIEEKFLPKPVTSALRANRRPPVPIWVQPASLAVGRVWAGPFQDLDANGIMEFAPASAPIPSGQWSRELNFLGFVGADGKPVAALPAGLKLRATVQWREPHDPDAGLAPETAFPLNLRLLRQLDPEGKTLATDEMVEVGVSAGQPVRLLKTLGSAAFEQTLEVTIPVAGVHALRLEGRPGRGLFGQPQHIEIYPRIVIEALGSTTGQPVFRSGSGNAVGVGIPGDSPAAVTIGATGLASLSGTGPGVTLSSKPDLLAPGTTGTAAGTGVAAGYAAGTAASLLSAGVRLNDLGRITGLKPGQPLVLSREWLSNIRPRSER